MTEVRLGVVCQNHYPYLGGAEYANHQLAAAMHELPETHVSVAFCEMPRLPRDLSYPYPHYRARSFSYLTDWLRRRNVERMVAEERPNLLFGSVLHGGGLRALQVGRRHGLPVLARVHGSDVQLVPAIGYGAQLDRKLVSRAKRVVADADRVIVLSEINRRDAVSLGADESKVFVIANGVAHREIAAIPQENVRARYGVRDEDFLVVTVGRNSVVKRIDLLYRALVLARRHAPSIRCLSIGPERNLAETARRCGAEDAVTLTGPIVAGGDPPFPELVNLMRSADLYVSVSHVESFGNAAAEALACGTPVLVTPRQGIRDVIVEGETGFVQEEETPDALATTLVALCGEREELARRRGRIRDSMAHLTWKRTAEQLREVTVSLL